MIKYLTKQVVERFKKKKCVLRVDLNIENPKSFFDLYRLKLTLPTIRLLIEHNIKVIILSHRGRPKNKNDKKLSLKNFKNILQKELKEEVIFFSGFNWGKIKRLIQKSKKRIFLLENLRFLKGEEKNDKKLAKKLASLGDFYVNDAFAASHRQNTSLSAITEFLPSFGGILMKKELKNLNEIIAKQRHPLTIIIGGAKIKDKLGVVENFWQKTDCFLLGGGPANTFLKAEGMDIGKSLFDNESLKKIKKYLNEEKIILPIDFKMKNFEILDIGEKTIQEYKKIIKKSKTIIWNGPMGAFEKKGFQKGTVAIWTFISQNKNAKIIIGGGETIASLNTTPAYLRKKILQAKNIFISTGGGAMLQYLSGKTLPAIETLKKS